MSLDLNRLIQFPLSLWHPIHNCHICWPGKVHIFRHDNNYVCMSYQTGGRKQPTFCNHFNTKNTENVWTGVVNCSWAHERIILVIISQAVKQRWKWTPKYDPSERIISSSRHSIQYLNYYSTEWTNCEKDDLNTSTPHLASPLALFTLWWWRHNRVRYVSWAREKYLYVFRYHFYARWYSRPVL